MQNLVDAIKGHIKLQTGEKSQKSVYAMFLFFCRR